MRPSASTSTATTFESACARPSSSPASFELPTELITASPVIRPPSLREAAPAFSAAFWRIVLKSPMPIVTEAASSASVGEPWSFTARPESSAGVLPSAYCA